MSRKKREAAETGPLPEVPAVEQAPAPPDGSVDSRTPAEKTLDRRLGWGLFIVATALLLVTEKPAGFVRDESVYFASAEQHARWFQLLASAPSQAFTDAAIAQSFEFNHEHPALMKNAYGLSFLVLHEKLGLLRPAAAFRFPAFLAAALILPLLFSLTRRAFGRPAGLMAAASFLLVPRQFFEAHLSCFDVPMATAWLLVVFCFLEALEKPRWWLYTGLAFGAAMGTKHNAYFIPVVLFPFAFAKALSAGSQHRQRTGSTEALRIVQELLVILAATGGLLALTGWILGDRFLSTFQLLSPQLGVALLGMAAAVWRTQALAKVDVRTFRAVAPLVAMAVLGPALFYLHWPWLWHHPVDRFAWYLSFHLNHEHYTWFYLGELLRQPPFPLSYVLVKTAMTVPTSLFLPMVFGVVLVIVRAVTWRRGSAPSAGISFSTKTWAAHSPVTFLELLVLANAATSIIVLSQPSVPHFGGVKHWFPSMPFLALLAAGSVLRGVEGLVAWLQPKLPKLEVQRVFIGVSALLFAPALIASVRVYPYGTSHYSELAGGLPGAAAMGMQRQFWANNVTGVLEWINQNARPGERVYLHECHGGQVRDYQRNGMLRQDLRFVGGPFDADLVAYQYHQEFRETEFQTWQAFGTTKPVTGLYVDETPQIVVYRRR
ncbi:MAG: glycosyltransferase family 39 protein [Myxococcus sp.]|nr:glycosyltransferase family 39 protein [Myxococcus sp.]